MSKDSIIIIIGFAMTLLVTYGASRYFTGIWMRLSLRWGIVSKVTYRSSHAVPTARLGGAGLAMGFGLGALLCLVLAHVEVLIGHDRYCSIIETNYSMTIPLAIGWMMMFLVGLADDVWDLPPLVKLAGEILAALVAVIGARLFLAPAGGANSSDGVLLIGAAAAFVWILFFTNAYNFMDGMDGFAGGFARETSLTMFALVLLGIALSPDSNGAAGDAALWLMPVLAMACWGFLHWNNPPAKVFMGDAGALSVGYLLSAWPLLGVGGRLGAPLPWTVSMTILMPFTFDVILTLIRRARRGENVLKAHREHLYQRLMITGLSHAIVLKLTRRRFHQCAALALVATLIDTPLARWACLALSVVVMLLHWVMTLVRERASRP